MLVGRRQRPSLATRGAVAWACAICLLSAPALAQSTSDELARRHFDSGVAYLEESDYESALKAFEKALELSKRPPILLNIATVHERRSDLPAAVAALQGYLQAEPEGEHAETVRLRLQNLEKRLAEQERAKQAAAPPPAAPAAVSPAPPTPPREPEQPRTQPPPNRLPAVIALGAGGVMAGGALFTGILAKTQYDAAEDSCAPRCSDEQISSSRSLALTSTVMTGAALLGVGLGVALLLTSDRDEARAFGARPRIDVALGPGAAAAGARWSF
jgi:tetratricopeptide (TPR) repeat protein